MNNKKLRKILIDVLELNANNLPEVINVENSENWVFGAFPNNREN